jgi:hypothetical protein
MIHGSRAVTGFGATPLPPSEWIALLEFYGYTTDADLAHDTFELLLALDQKWVLLQHRKDKPDADT